MEVATFQEPAARAFSGHAFRVELAQVDVAVAQEIERRRVSELAARWPQHLAVNASFFDETGKTMGRVVDAGRVLVEERRKHWGALVIDKGSARIVPGDALPADVAGGDIVLQGVPRLVIGGQVPKLKPAEAERTAVCAEGGTLHLVVTTTPADATDFGRFLARKLEDGGLGCTSALNFDGGPSTQVNARLGALKLAVDGGWAVPNALVVIPRSAMHPRAPDAPPADGGGVAGDADGGG